MKWSSSFALAVVGTAISSISSLSSFSAEAAAASSSSILKGHDAPRRNTDILKRMLQKAEKQSNNNNNKGNKNTPPPPATPPPTTPTTTTTNTASAYYSGILLDTKVSNTYIYNTPINVEFELNNNLTGISTEILLNLNTSHVNDWELGVFMRMADPQGGALEPIFAIKPTSIVNKMNTASRSRKLQDDVAAEAEAMADAISANANSTSDIPVVPPLTPPIVNYVGTAKISTTDATMLDPVLYGTGFDLFLLDERGGAILGPATFYILPTPAMKEKEQQEIDHRPDHGLVNHDGSAKQQQGADANSKAGKATAEKEKLEKDAKAAKDMGYGSGTNGSMVLATREALAKYVLTTDKDLYDEKTDVTITYDIAVDDTDGSSRRLQNMFGSGAKTTTTTTTTTTTQATVAAAASKGTTTTIATAATTTTTTKGTNKGTTTTSATTTTTSGAVKLPPLPPIIDGENIKNYRMGVYMRMAHPQDGSLAPILSIPFCPTPCSKTPAQLEAGTFTFNLSELNLAKYGTGYDVWILDGFGVGIAGPKTFYVNVPEEEEESAAIDGEL